MFNLIITHQNSRKNPLRKIETNKYTVALITFKKLFTI